MKRILAILLVLLLLSAGFAETADGFGSDYAAMNRAAGSALILVKKGAGGKELGVYSGFMAFDGKHALTVTEALDGASSLTAFDDAGNKLSGVKVLAADSDIGIAILAFDKKTALEPLALKTDAEIKRGTPCISIAADGKLNAINSGNISAFFTDKGVSYVQFTAPLSANATGGALFDDAGRVVGVTVSGYESPYGKVQNLNFAVDISHAQDLWELCRKDKPVKVADWRQTDICFGNPLFDGAREFTVINDSGYKLSAIKVSAMGMRGGQFVAIKQAVHNWVTNGTSFTLAIDADTELTGDETVDFTVEYSGSYGSGSISKSFPSLGELLGKTLSLTVNLSAKSISLTEIDTGTETPKPRHVKKAAAAEESFSIPETVDREIPGNICVIMNQSDKWLTKGSLICHNIHYEDYKLIPEAVAPGGTFIVYLPEQYFANRDIFWWLELYLGGSNSKVSREDNKPDKDTLSGTVVYIKYDEARKEYYCEYHTEWREAKEAD